MVVRPMLAGPPKIQSTSTKMAPRSGSLPERDFRAFVLPPVVLPETKVLAEPAPLPIQSAPAPTFGDRPFAEEPSLFHLCFCPLVALEPKSEKGQQSDVDVPFAVRVAIFVRGPPDVPMACPVSATPAAIPPTPAVPPASVIRPPASISSLMFDRPFFELYAPLHTNFN